MFKHKLFKLFRSIFFIHKSFNLMAFPARPALVPLAVDVVVLGPGEVLRVLPLGGGGVEHDVVYGLDELQLHDALDGQHREQLLLLRHAGRLLLLLAGPVAVVAGRRVPDVPVNLEHEAGVHRGAAAGPRRVAV